MFSVKDESAGGGGVQDWRRTHINEIAELIWKDRQILWQTPCLFLSAFVSLTFMDAFVNAVNRMAGKF